MTYSKALAFLLLLYSILNIPPKLNAVVSPEETKPVGEANKTSAELVHQISPSPSPAPGNSNLDSGDAKIDVNPPPIGKETKETCDLVSNQCHEDSENVTACVLPYAGDGPMELLVLNKGNDSRNFNVTAIPSGPIYNNYIVPGHEIRKINVCATASRTSSVVLKAVNWTCTIQLAVHVPIGFSFPSYAVYVTPVNGVYVLLGTAFLIGIMWGCCKLGKNRRHLDGGVPYQELEMGQQQQQQSTSSVEVATAADWDEDWDDDDDDWDDDKAVMSPSGNRVGNTRANGGGGGGSSRFQETNGWEID